MSAIPADGSGSEYLRGSAPDQPSAALDRSSRARDSHADVWSITSALDLHDEIAQLQEQLRTSQDQVENLTVALNSARQIGAAVGIVMTRFKVRENAAFQILTRVSQNQNRKLRDVAADVVYTGTIEDVPPLRKRSATRPAGAAD